MDMYDSGLAFPKPTPRSVVRKTKEKTLSRDERTCRTEVRKRDKGRCQIPGCFERGRMHQHHVVFRSQSKRLKHVPENLVTLCTDHHRLVHDGTITITRAADGELIVTGDVDRLRFRL